MAYTDIDKPSDYFNTVLYTGNGSGQTISGVGFQPDWNWTKCRTATQSHVLTDSVRGVTKTLFTNATQAETTLTNGLTSFNSDGYAFGDSALWTDNTKTFASWNWKKTADAGFDIVSYTGNGSNRTISHNLGAVPKMMIVKERDNANDWKVYHHSIGNGKSLRLDTSAAQGDDSTAWNSTTPTSSVFSVGTSNAVNRNGGDIIAYCFADTGNKFFKAGSYTGNGNVSGSYIHLGFKAAWLLVKSTAANDWILHDTKRNPHNVSNVILHPNASDADVTNTIYNLDILSNGFKTRTTHARLNGSGVTYIYMAFAENPFVTSTGVPACAR